MSRTRIDLVTKVLDLLNVSQVGQAPSDEDAEVVSREIGPVFASLARRNVLYVQFDDAIEDEFFNPLAVIVANNVGPSFGQSFDPSTDAMQEGLLRDMQRTRRPSSVLRTDYF